MEEMIANKATADAELLPRQDAPQSEVNRVLGELDRYPRTEASRAIKAVV